MWLIAQLTGGEFFAGAIVLFVAFFGLFFGVIGGGIWMARDVERRGEDSTKWLGAYFIGGFFFFLVGALPVLVAWYLLRPDEVKETDADKPDGIAQDWDDTSSGETDW